MRPFSFISNTQATPTTHWKSQVVLTLLQYYFSFFQANFPVSLSIPICRVLNPGKIHILYITFTHNILHMAKKCVHAWIRGQGMFFPENSVYVLSRLNLTNKLLVSIKIKETFSSNPF